MSNYPSPPGLRIPYDRDGSAGFYWYGGYSVGQIAQAEMASLNNNALSSVPDYLAAPFNNSITIGFVFSLKWDLKGYYLDVDSPGNPGDIEWSGTSTNGIDGNDWTVLDSPVIFERVAAADGYRRNIRLITQAGVKAIRTSGSMNLFNGSWRFKALHLYGEPSAGQSLDMLVPWHPTLDQFADGTTADYGDVQRATSATRQYRVKNYSTTFTAHSVMTSINVQNDTSPSLTTQFVFSLDNATWFTSLNIGDLAPGAISSIIYAKDSVDPAEPVSVHDIRFLATATNWS